MTWVCPMSALSVEREQTKNQTLLIDGVSERLLEGGQTSNYFSRIIYMGVYHEYIFGTSQSLYTASPIGALFGFQHTLGKVFRGGLELRWSHWKSKEDQDLPAYVMPVALYSKIVVQPRISLGSGALSPYVNAGIGYMVPFQGDRYFSMTVPKSLGMLVFIMGGGLEWLMSKSFGVNIGFDTWLDLERKNFFAGAPSLSMVIRF